MIIENGKLIIEQAMQGKYEVFFLSPSFTKSVFILFIRVES